MFSENTWILLHPMSLRSLREKKLKTWKIAKSTASVKCITIPNLFNVICCIPPMLFFVFHTKLAALRGKRQTTTAFVNFTYSGRPLIRSPMGQKKVAVLTGDRIKEGIFTRKCRAVWPSGQNKVAVITMLPYYRDGRKMGFHCIYITYHHD